MDERVAEYQDAKGIARPQLRPPEAVAVYVREGEAATVDRIVDIDAAACRHEREEPVVIYAIRKPSDGIDEPEEQLGDGQCQDGAARGNKDLGCKAFGPRK